MGTSWQNACGAVVLVRYKVHLFHELNLASPDSRISGLSLDIKNPYFPWMLVMTPITSLDAKLIKEHSFIRIAQKEQIDTGAVNINYSLTLCLLNIN